MNSEDQDDEMSHKVALHQGFDKSKSIYNIFVLINICDPLIFIIIDYPD